MFQYSVTLVLCICHVQRREKSDGVNRRGTRAGGRIIGPPANDDRHMAPEKEKSAADVESEVGYRTL